jgi:pilus assembly protein CpaE
MVFAVFKSSPPHVISRERPAPAPAAAPSQPSVAASTKGKGHIVGVLSAKGGSGASTIAVNVSALLAEKFGSTVLVDANLQNPDAALILGQTAQFGLLELLTGASAPTAEAVEACSVHFAGRKHPWSLLSPPVSGEAALKTQLSNVAGCLTATRANADYWIVDLSNHLDRHLVTMLDACDTVVVIFEETMAGVSAARRWWNTFTQLEYKPERILYVMNRAGSRNRAAAAAIKELLPANAVCVPNCFDLLDEGLAKGEPAVISHPKHKFSQAIHVLVDQIAGMLEAKHG